MIALISGVPNPFVVNEGVIKRVDNGQFLKDSPTCPLSNIRISSNPISINAIAIPIPEGPAPIITTLFDFCILTPHKS